MVRVGGLEGTVVAVVVLWDSIPDFAFQKTYHREKTVLYIKRKTVS
jgi:hypothetical protein